MEINHIEGEQIELFGKDATEKELSILANAIGYAYISTLDPDRVDDGVVVLQGNEEEAAFAAAKRAIRQLNRFREGDIIDESKERDNYG